MIYRLMEHPLKLMLTPPELDSLKAIATALYQQPVLTPFQNFCSLAKQLCVHLPEETLFTKNGSLLQHTSPHIQKHVELFQRYCQERRVLELTWHDETDAVQRTLTEPVELICKKKRIYLMGVNPKTRTKESFPLDRMVTHRQIPSISKTPVAQMTLVFKLTGRVARNYRPYPGETVTERDEFLWVTHRTEDSQPLLRRLLKYGPSCEVMSPLSARRQMHAMVTRLLNALDTTP
jgi:predicted DNA-binding transcriptional regulator YafY